MQIRDRIKGLRRVRAGDLRPHPKNWRKHPEAQQNALRSTQVMSGRFFSPSSLAGYMTSVVYAFTRESGDKFKPAIGRGAAQQRHQWYNRPTRTGSVVRQIGEGYHINFLRSEKLRLVEVDADHWKTWVHQRLVSPVDSDGAMTLFEASPQQHLALAKHLTAEVKTEEFVAGKGVVVKWERLRRQNHWFDAIYNACAAGHFCGVRLVEEPKVVQQRHSLAEWARMANEPSARELAAQSR